jgi:class 3 adenylate cyclase
MTRELSNTLFVRIVPVVEQEDRLEWEKYSVENGDWVQSARDYNADNGLGPFLPDVENLDYTAGITGIPNRIFAGFSETGLIYDEGPGPYYPLWQESPTFGRDLSNWNVAYYPPYADYVIKSVETGEIAIGGIDTADPGTIHSDDLTIAYFALMQSMAAGEPVTYDGDPMSTVFVPIFDSFEADRKPTAVIFALMKWATYFESLLPPNSPGVMVVLENTCEGPFTYKVVGDNVEYIGKGNLHNTDFSHWERSVDFDGKKIIEDESSLGIGINQDLCAYKLRVYPSEELYDEYHTNLPIIITCAVALAFLVTAAVFILYNHLVEQRQKLVMHQAVKSTAIVSSLFPEAVRDRLLMPSGKNRLKSFLKDGDDDEIDETPIADLFPHTTVFFADIAGFTAWSSTREPQAVFTLLQSLYQAFDVIAKRRKVFKVETIGDSYVAVSGLPNPDDQHFVSMARFAVDCLAKFSELVHKLEQKLGPDTGELGLRVGLNSGPVTAGVLRGERSRFQLFGDTVNTAARMER